MRRILNAVLIVMIGLFVRDVVAQIADAEIRRLIRTESWSPGEILALEKGDAVVRSLETRDKQELATLGAVRIRNLPAISMEMFRRSLDQKSESAMTVGGRFSQPPVLADLSELQLDDETIAQLNGCAVRRCDLNLSAHAIGQFQRFDWKSPDAKQIATDMLREVLLAYVQGYSTRGIASLGSYDNRRKTVDLAASHRTLLQDSTEVLELAPEFCDYLAQYPDLSLANVENTMHWSVVDFGLKPSITLSHASAYTQTTSGTEQLFVASRQIYSTRYLDSSISFAILLHVAGESDGSAYLLFIDRSRSDALDGPLGSVARTVVQKDASERVRKMLDRAHVRLLSIGKPAVAEKRDSRQLTWPILTGLGIVVAVVLAIVIRQVRRRTTLGRHRI